VLRRRDVAPDTLVSALRAKGLTVRSLQTVAPSLEDVFLDVAERVAKAS
jgi:hypothetical protein